MPRTKREIGTPAVNSTKPRCSDIRESGAACSSAAHNDPPVPQNVHDRKARMRKAQSLIKRARLNTSGMNSNTLKANNKALAKSLARVKEELSIARDEVLGAQSELVRLRGLQAKFEDQVKSEVKTRLSTVLTPLKSLIISSVQSFEAGSTGLMGVLSRINEHTQDERASLPCTSSGPYITSVSRTLRDSLIRRPMSNGRGLLGGIVKPPLPQFTHFTSLLEDSGLADAPIAFVDEEGGDEQPVQVYDDNGLTDLIEVDEPDTRPRSRSRRRRASSFMSIPSKDSIVETNEEDDLTLSQNNPNETNSDSKADLVNFQGNNEDASELNGSLGQESASLLVENSPAERGNSPIACETSPILVKNAVDLVPTSPTLVQNSPDLVQNSPDLVKNSPDLVKISDLSTDPFLDSEIALNSPNLAGQTFVVEKEKCEEDFAKTMEMKMGSHTSSRRRSILPSASIDVHPLSSVTFARRQTYVLPVPDNPTATKSENHLELGSKPIAPIKPIAEPLKSVAKQCRSVQPAEVLAKQECPIQNSALTEVVDSKCNEQEISPSKLGGKKRLHKDETFCIIGKNRNKKKGLEELKEQEIKATKSDAKRKLTKKVEKVVARQKAVKVDQPSAAGAEDMPQPLEYRPSLIHTPIKAPADLDNSLFFHKIDSDHHLWKKTGGSPPLKPMAGHILDEFYKVNTNKSGNIPEQMTKLQEEIVDQTPTATFTVSPQPATAERKRMSKCSGEEDESPLAKVVRGKVKRHVIVSDDDQTLPLKKVLTPKKDVQAPSNVKGHSKKGVKISKSEEVLVEIDKHTKKKGVSKWAVCKPPKTLPPYDPYDIYSATDSPDLRPLKNTKVQDARLHRDSTSLERTLDESRGSRRNKKVVSYKEPSISSKMRRGDTTSNQSFTLSTSQS